MTTEADDKLFDVLNNWYEKAIADGKGFQNDKERSDYISTLGNFTWRKYLVVLDDDDVNDDDGVMMII